MKINNKYLIRFLLFSILCFLSCKAPKEEQSKSEKETKFEVLVKSLKKIDLPYNSKEIDKCIEKNNGFVFSNSLCLFKESIEYKQYANNLNSDSSNDDFYLTKTKDYFPISKYKIGELIVILSKVNYSLEDFFGASIQLNLFDLKGNQKDFLIVFNRFQFETHYKYDFNITKDFNNIEVNITRFNNIVYDEETGDILQEKKSNPLTSESKLVYEINSNGKFVISE